MLTGTDILMITYNRAAYTKRSLQRLLDTAPDYARIWVWHNGGDTETLEIVKSFLGHPRLHKFHHSEENVRLVPPTNWLWNNASGYLIGKVDDDFLVPDQWIEKLHGAHVENSRFGVISAWQSYPEDFDENVARKKIRSFKGGHQLLQNAWVAGTCYLMKRECVLGLGQLHDGESFPKYCTELAWKGWVNGYYFPLLYGDHMDDPRSPYTMMVDDQAMSHYAPLTAKKNGVTTRQEFIDLIVDAARSLQTTRRTPGRFFQLRRAIRSLMPAENNRRLIAPTAD